MLKKTGACNTDGNIRSERVLFIRCEGLEKNKVGQERTDIKGSILNF